MRYTYRPETGQDGSDQHWWRRDVPVPKSGIDKSDTKSVTSLERQGFKDWQNQTDRGTCRATPTRDDGQVSRISRSKPVEGI